MFDLTKSADFLTDSYETLHTTRAYVLSARPLRWHRAGPALAAGPVTVHRNVWSSMAPFTQWHWHAKQRCRDVGGQKQPVFNNGFQKTRFILNDFVCNIV
jgi:hypothetical protein